MQRLVSYSSSMEMPATRRDVEIELLRAALRTADGSNAAWNALWSALGEPIGLESYVWEALEKPAWESAEKPFLYVLTVARRLERKDQPAYQAFVEARKGRVEDIDMERIVQPDGPGGKFRDTYQTDEVLDALPERFLIQPQYPPMYLQQIAKRNAVQEHHESDAPKRIFNWSVVCAEAGLDDEETRVHEAKAIKMSREQALQECEDRTSRLRLQAAWRRYDRQGMAQQVADFLKSHLPKEFFG